MSDNGFLRNDKLKSVLSRIKTRVGFDIAEAISESTLSLTSIINSGDSTTLGSAKGYADGLKIVIDSNISLGDLTTLQNAKDYTDTKVSNLSVNGHTHTTSDITNFGSYASSLHTHTVSDITDASTELASKSHTHTESDITDLGNYASSTHTHSSSDLTDGTTTFASKSHTHTESDITNLGNYATATHSHNLSDINSISATATEINYLSGVTGNIQQQLNSLTTSGTTLTLADLGGASSTDLSNHTGNTNNPHSVTYSQVGAAAASHTHTESDITDLGSYASSSHTHVETDITDLGSYASSSHTHTVSDITDASSLASSSHMHLLSDVTDVTASNTEVNYLVNSTRNIQTQINDARMYGFFPAWEYQHEYDVEDCIKIPCCKTTQYLECIVAGISGSCPEWIIEETGEYYKLDEFIAVVNGQCIVDGTCVWLVQDIRDARTVGSITLLLWRPVFTNAYDNYGIGLQNSTILYSRNADKRDSMNTSAYLKYIRLIKYCLGSFLFSVDFGASERYFTLIGHQDLSNASNKYLAHIGSLAAILDWCVRPFDYLKSENLNSIDERVFTKCLNDYVITNYNSTYSTSITKSNIISDATQRKNKMYNNQISDGTFYMRLEANNDRYIRYGLYGQFLSDGLPNITGSLGYIHSHGSSTNLNNTSNTMFWGSVTKNDSTYSYTASSGNKMYNGIQFKASNANSIYGSSTKVQPKSILAYYYMKY